MKSPRWPVLLVAILLGVATGDAVLLTASPAAHRPAVPVVAPDSQPLSPPMHLLLGKKA